ncbi:hypothetical protein ACWGR4_19870 [Embleya sp. NPDC055664]
MPTKRETVRSVLGDKVGSCELVTLARPGGGSLPARSSLIGGGRSRWVSEGFAYCLAGDNSYRDAARAELRAGRFSGKLPVDTDLLPNVGVIRPPERASTSAC